MLAIERILRLRDANVPREAALLRRLAQREGDVEIGDRWELHRQVVATGAFVANGAANDPNRARLDVVLHGARGADANEGVDANVGELFNGDRRGGAADAGGGAGNGHAVELTGPGGVFAAAHEELWIVEAAGDDLNAIWVAREQHVAADLALLNADMVLAAVVLSCCHQCAPPARYGAASFAASSFDR